MGDGEGGREPDSGNEDEREERKEKETADTRQWMLSLELTQNE